MKTYRQYASWARRALVRATSLAALGIVTPAISQEPSAPSTAGRIEATALEEIIVTSRKFQEPLQDTPIAVSAITGDVLESRGIDDLDGIANFVPNLQIDFTAPISGSSNATSVFIRGIGQTDFLLSTDPGVGLYVDGVYVARSPGGLLDLVDVERVEVLRGPQGTLFGRNTIGGAISIISRPPSFEEFEARGSVTAGRFDRFDTQLAVNLPIVADRLAMRLSGASYNRDGYARRLVDDAQLGDKNSETARISALWRAAETLDIQLTGDWTRAREASAAQALLAFDVSQPPFGVLTGLYNAIVAPNTNVPGFGVNVPYDARWVTADSFTTFQTGRNSSTLDVRGVSLTAEWGRTDSAQLKSITAYRDLESSFGRDADQSPLQIIETNNALVHHQFSQELQFTSSLLDEALTLVVGAYYFNEEGRDDLAINIVPELFNFIPVDVLIRGASFTSTDSYALYAQGNYALSEKLDLNLGVRYTDETKGFRSTTHLPRSGVALLPDQEFETGFTNVSPRVGLDFKPNDDVLIYASASRGFKSGGFNGRYTAPRATPLVFEPEKLWAYELGLKSELLDRKMRLNTALFYSDYSNVQVLFFEGATPFNRNAAKAVIQGVEVELTARVTHGLTLTGSAAYTDAEYERLEPGSAIAIDNRLVNTPEWTMNAGVRYSIPVGEGSIDLSGDWLYRDTTANDAINTPELIQPSYDLLAASIGYVARNERWSLTLAGTNLTDEEYLVSGVADKPTFGLVEGNYARPREWSLRLAVRF